MGRKLPGADERDGNEWDLGLDGHERRLLKEMGRSGPEAARPPSGKRTMGMPALRAIVARPREPTEVRVED